jgi:uncharacterized membrane protein
MNKPDDWNEDDRRSLRYLKRWALILIPLWIIWVLVREATRR